MSKDQRPNGRRIPAFEFQEALENKMKTQSQAKQIIQMARQQAQSILKDAEVAAATQHRELESLTNKELRSFIDEDRLKRHAKTFVKALSEISTIRKSHAEMTPWLIDLVYVSLRRIIGEIEAKEVTARMVRQGIRELHESQNVKLWVHPDTFDAASVAKESHPEMMASITNISTDTQLPPGTLKLTCDIGSVSLSVDARLQRILEAIEDSSALGSSPKVKM